MLGLLYQMLDPQKILFVSDDALSTFTRAALEQRGFTVAAAAGIEAGYGQLRDSSFDLVIIDLGQAEAGIEFLRRLRAVPKRRKTFVLTLADWGTGQATLALTEGADAYEPKPVSPERLIAAVERLLRQRVAKTVTAANVIGGIKTDE